jgi:hypothetical protein
MDMQRKIPERKISEPRTELKAFILSPRKFALLCWSLSLKSGANAILAVTCNRGQWRLSVLVVIDF